MSNFKIYLEKVQGNHEAKIETSNFLNENFRNYMEKVFYMELTGTPVTKTGINVRDTNLATPDVAIGDQKADSTKTANVSSKLPAFIESNANLKSFVNKIYKGEKKIDFKLTTADLAGVEDRNKQIKINVLFGGYTPIKINIPNYTEKEFQIKNKDNKYIKYKNKTNIELNEIIRISGHMNVLLAQDIIKVNLNINEVITILKNYFSNLFGKEIETKIFFTNSTDIIVDNKNIELEISSISNENNDNQVGGKVVNINNSQDNNKIFIHIEKTK